MSKFVQDMPPKGGYPYPVQWKRNLPARGFRPSIYFAAVMGICGYGFYKLCAGIHERNELTREQTWSRFYLQPLLEAEADRDYLRRYISLKNQETEIMSSVPDFDANKSVYNEDKFHKPSLVAFPKI